MIAVTGVRGRHESIDVLEVEQGPGASGRRAVVVILGATPS